jgi:hypothetical protein
VTADPERCLAALGITTPAVSVRRHTLGKFGIRLAAEAGFIKLAPTRATIAGLRHEAAAYAQLPPPAPYRRPTLIGFHDDGDWAALWLKTETAAPWPRWRALVPRPGPYETLVAGRQPIGGLMPPAPAADFAGWHYRLLDRHGDRVIAVAPAHGDFIYWNLLDGPVLLDFEHFLEHAPRHYDRLSWTIVPLGRRAMALGLGRQAAAAGPWLARRLLPEGDGAEAELALFLLHHAARLEAENQLVAAADIEDHAAQRQRDRLLAFYPLLLARLLA